MSKRKHEEAIAADTESAGAHDVLKRKKSKKSKEERNSNAQDAPVENVSPAPEQNGEKAKKPKRTAEEKAAKAERKALKRAQKEAQQNEEQQSGQEDNGAEEDDAERIAAAKAARKAEKARLKAGKKSTKGAGHANGEPDSMEGVETERASNGTHATSNGDSNGTSNGASGGAYVDMPALAALPQSEIDSYLEKHHITIEDPKMATGVLKYRPITSFSYLPIKDKAQRAIFDDFSEPTPIQAASWPSLLAGRDVVGVAETGSGKTLAFGIPCIQYIKNLPPKQQKGAKAVIVSPTRELACQIHEQLIKIATPANLSSVVVYGGVDKDPQRQALKTANIIVATPGRLNDLIDEGSADLSKVGYVVLDEADRMLDKGFEDAIRAIIEKTPATPARQTLMFTATWPTSVRDLASTFMTSPVKINIGENTSGELRANLRIEQIVEVLDGRQKEQRLQQLLREHQKNSGKDARVLVFCLYKKEATRVENTLHRNGFKVMGIHGDLSQAARTASLDAFKMGKVPILVATDVAARGLDIPAVKLVINVTFPLTAEDYVHRIGRTGRAGKEGKAITLFTEQDKALSGALINVLKAANQPVPEELLKFGGTVKKKGHEAYGAFYKDTGDMKKTGTKITFD